MIRAIKTLEKKINLLNDLREKAIKTMDEPEMLSDYEFALNDAANTEAEIMEHQKAIEILSKTLEQ